MYYSPCITLWLPPNSDKAQRNIISPKQDSMLHIVTPATSPVIELKWGVNFKKTLITTLKIQLQDRCSLKLLAMYRWRGEPSSAQANGRHLQGLPLLRSLPMVKSAWGAAQQPGSWVWTTEEWGCETNRQKDYIVTNTYKDDWLCVPILSYIRIPLYFFYFQWRFTLHELRS